MEPEDLPVKPHARNIESPPPSYDRRLPRGSYPPCLSADSLPSSIGKGAWGSGVEAWSRAERVQLLLGRDSRLVSRRSLIDDWDRPQAAPLHS
jgi:hypothetical protein